MLATIGKEYFTVGGYVYEVIAITPVGDICIHRKHITSYVPRDTFDSMFVGCVENS